MLLQNTTTVTLLCRYKSNREWYLSLYHRSCGNQSTTTLGYEVDFIHYNGAALCKYLNDRLDDGEHHETRGPSPVGPSALQYTLQSVRKLTFYSCILESNVNMMEIKLWRKGDDGSRLHDMLHTTSLGPLPVLSSIVVSIWTLFENLSKEKWWTLSPATTSCRNVAMFLCGSSPAGRGRRQDWLVAADWQLSLREYLRLSWAKSLLPSAGSWYL